MNVVATGPNRERGNRAAGTAGTSARPSSASARAPGAANGSASTRAAAGTAGTAGTAGAATGGTAGGGTAGTAGSSSGGTVSGGEAGMSGGAGEGGMSSGGEGGEAGAPSAGAAGETSGEGGAAGATSTPSEPLTCVYTCESTDDCIAGAVCDPVRKHCEDPSSVCDNNEACLPMLSFWSMECDTTSECFEGQLCVEADGTGYCADEPMVEVGCTLGAPMTLPLFGSDTTAVVCGEAGARCIAHQCATACEPEAGCGSGLSCDAVSGACMCSEAANCQASLHPNAPRACQ